MLESSVSSFQVWSLAPSHINGARALALPSRAPAALQHRKRGFPLSPVWVCRAEGVAEQELA